MKNFKKTALALVVTLVAGYGVYTSQQKSELSELVLANIEALADNESPVKIPCVDDKSSECKFLTEGADGIWRHLVVQGMRNSN